MDGEKLGENFPVQNHFRKYTVHFFFVISGRMNERVVLYFHDYFALYCVIIVTQVDFLRFPTTNLFVAFPMKFLADQNVMSFAGGNLAFYSRDKTLTVFSSWNMNLN